MTRDFFLCLFFFVKRVLKKQESICKSLQSQKNKKIKKGRSSVLEKKKTKRRRHKEEVFLECFHHKPSAHKPHISYIHSAWVKTLFEHTHATKNETCGETRTKITSSLASTISSLERNYSTRRKSLKKLTNRTRKIERPLGKPGSRSCPRNTILRIRVMVFHRRR